jgi:energy-converting hydrogenase Eha subunit E
MNGNIIAMLMALPSFVATIVESLNVEVVSIGVVVSWISSTVSFEIVTSSACGWIAFC